MKYIFLSLWQFWQKWSCGTRLLLLVQPAELVSSKIVFISFSFIFSFGLEKVLLSSEKILVSPSMIVGAVVFILSQWIIMINFTFAAACRAHCASKTFIITA